MDFNRKRTIDDLQCETCCPFDYLNRKDFANIILSNPELTGYLVIYTEFGKGRSHAVEVSKIALHELVTKHKVPINRLKTIYGGKRQNPEIELWLVPKGDKLPKLTPEKRNKNI